MSVDPAVAGDKAFGDAFGPLQIGAPDAIG
jgi:hypothetical protein